MGSRMFYDSFTVIKVGLEINPGTAFGVPDIFSRPKLGAPILITKYITTYVHCTVQWVQ
jgi:hypothetical protein